MKNAIMHADTDPDTVSERHKAHVAPQMQLLRPGGRSQLHPAVKRHGRMGYRVEGMPGLIRLQPETFSRLVEEGSQRHETVDTAADRILREQLPVIRDTNSTLATLGRLKQLRARMKPGKGAVQIVHEGRRELDRRQP